MFSSCNSSNPLRSGRVRQAILGLAVFVLALAGASPSSAEPPGGADRKNQLGLYFWIPVLDGSATLGDTTTPIESSLSDLDIGGPFGYARTPEPWGALVTTIYLKVDSGFQTSMPGRSGTDTFEFFMADTVTNRRWGFKNDNVDVELLTGLRYWKV